MEANDSTPEYNVDIDIAHSGQTASERTKRFVHQIGQYNVLNHALGFVVAVLLTVTAMGCALFMLVYQFLHPELTTTAWPEVTISFILGVWLTNRPKFVRHKRTTR